MVKIFNRVFTKKRASKEDTIPIKRLSKQNTENDVTKPLTPLPEPNDQHKETIYHPNLEPSQLRAGCAQSTGCQRDHNEDALFCLTTIMTGNGGATPFGLYIVADGMGGHQHGEIASEIAVRTMAGHVINEVFSNLISPEPRPPEESFQEIMKSGVKKAHDNVLERVTGGGTTLTAVTIFSNQMTIAHVGDSRIYLIRPNGNINPLTRDHSLVKRLEELGQLTPEEAAADPRKNVLYHALGQGTPLEPEIISAPLPHSSYLLICSDGLWGVITEKKISETIYSAETLEKACQDLVNAANEAGGPDNITAILVRLPN